MSATSLLLVLSPFLALALVLCAVMVVAICRARPEDVPTVTSTFVIAFLRLADRLPRKPRSLLDDEGPDPTADNGLSVADREEMR